MPRKNARGLQGNVPFKQPEYTKKKQQGQENEKKTICYVFPAQRQQETEKHTKTILSLSLCFVFSLLFCFPWPTA